MRGEGERRRRPSWGWTKERSNQLDLRLGLLGVEGGAAVSQASAGGGKEVTR